MTRTFNFTFPVANQWYNLFSLIQSDPSWGTKLVRTPSVNLTLPDNNFEYGPFMPSNVKVLKYQSQNALVNSNNGGAVIEKSSDPSNELGLELLSGSWDYVANDTSIISLKEVYFRSTITGAGINVEIDC
jgi:hypothetical protein